MEAKGILYINENDMYVFKTGDGEELLGDIKYSWIEHLEQRGWKYVWTHADGHTHYFEKWGDNMEIQQSCINEVKQETNEDRIFQLECQVSMLTDYIIQIVDELNKAGIKVSNKLKWLIKLDFYKKLICILK